MCLLWISEGKGGGTGCVGGGEGGLTYFEAKVEFWLSGWSLVRIIGFLYTV